MLDHKKIEKRLQNVDDQLCVAFAVRCSLRVLPLLVLDENKEAFWYWKETVRSQHLLAILMAQQNSTSFSAFGEKTNATSVATVRASATRIAADAARAIAVNSAMAVYAVTYATAYADETQTIVKAALRAATYASATDIVYIETEILQDLDKITSNDNAFNRSTSNNVSCIDLMLFPLWSGAIPQEWQLLHTRFDASMRSLNAGFEIWLDWYQDRVEGKPLDKEQEEKWLTIPAEIREQGVKATNAYLASLQIPVKQQSFNLVRTIFIGNGAAGKTSLIKVLHNEDVVEGKEEMTAGIEIREWPVPNTDIKARFWDFGGQVMSHSTHQFFLRERCLYILVLDARTEFNANDQAEYWLEHVKAFGKDAPVMLVGNKTDLTAVNLDMNALREKYPNIIDFYPLSCTRQTARFKSRFATFHTDLVQQLKAIGKDQLQFTDNQFRVLKKLREHSKKDTLLSHDHFDTLCRQHDIGKVGLSQTDFLGVLDKLGEVIHFPHLPLLNGYVLNPRWLTYGVYTLLYATKANEQQGVLSTNDVIAILQAESIEDEQGNDLHYPTDKCIFILQAMEAFKLCYRLTTAQDHFVIPDKLPTEQPELKGYFDKHLAGTLAFEFTFRGFLPRHIMPNLIVSRHSEIVNNKAGKQLVWQHGVILYNQLHCAKAQLQVDYHQRVLNLWVQGEESREFLAILRDEVTQILQRMEKLVVNELVILPNDALIEDSRSFVSRDMTKIEKAPYQRLLAEAKSAQTMTISDSGRYYDLLKIMGFIMTEKQQKKEGMSVTQHFHGEANIGAQNFGKKGRASGKVIIKKGDQKLVTDFQDSLTNLMQYIQNHEADFEVKADAYAELKQIRTYLERLEEASPETQGKLRQLLGSVKDGSSEAIKLSKNIKECEETLQWLMTNAELIINFLSGIV